MKEVPNGYQIKPEEIVQILAGIWQQYVTVEEARLSWNSCGNWLT